MLSVDASDIFSIRTELGLDLDHEPLGEEAFRKIVRRYKTRRTPKPTGWAKVVERAGKQQQAGCWRNRRFIPR